MKFLSDLIEDVIETGEKIVRSPLRMFCGVEEHEWVQQPDGSVKCATCAATQKIKR